ncbi:hypothetical protein M427DRAFT_43074 [Gonapodya prolifera JEL478]|uniref:Uncharacterized protein n=1 Tax=Gonapodya prolifera (strain JEL478) TaxID=1344416 RepID=A0A139ALN8_GONPJ|nr:hypothetical protein M427DRAFT_43074 [Gonapodya prolifera JEL478]|eukprot:KXS17423.1 hypothetical protein M427DRAFT_43074 [Gonapodya prolifera JEL478]
MLCQSMGDGAMVRTKTLHGIEAETIMRALDGVLFPNLETFIFSLSWEGIWDTLEEALQKEDNRLSSNPGRKLRIVMPTWEFQDSKCVKGGASWNLRDCYQDSHIYQWASVKAALGEGRNETFSDATSNNNFMGLVNWACGIREESDEDPATDETPQSSPRRDRIGSEDDEPAYNASDCESCVGYRDDHLVEVERKKFVEGCGEATAVKTLSGGLFPNLEKFTFSLTKCETYEDLADALSAENDWSSSPKHSLQKIMLVPSASEIQAVKESWDLQDSVTAWTMHLARLLPELPQISMGICESCLGKSLRRFPDQTDAKNAPSLQHVQHARSHSSKPPAKAALLASKTGSFVDVYGDSRKFTEERCESEACLSYCDDCEKIHCRWCGAKSREEVDDEDEEWETD